MPELLPENDHPANLKAKQLLMKVDDPPEPELLYLLQLAEYGLRPSPRGKPKLRFPSMQGEAAASLLLRLFLMSPENALNLLHGSPDDSRLPKPSQMLSALQASVLVLDRLVELMQDAGELEQV